MLWTRLWTSLRTPVVCFLAIAAFAAETHQATKADIEGWMTSLSNWGRWGKADEIGTVNLITPASRAEAAALAEDGGGVSLSHHPRTEQAPDHSQAFHPTPT